MLHLLWYSSPANGEISLSTKKDPLSGMVVQQTCAVSETLGIFTQSFMADGTSGI